MADEGDENDDVLIDDGNGIVWDAHNMWEVETHIPGSDSESDSDDDDEEGEEESLPEALIDGDDFDIDEDFDDDRDDICDVDLEDDSKTRADPEVFVAPSDILMFTDVPANQNEIVLFLRQDSLQRQARLVSRFLRCFLRPTPY